MKRLLLYFVSILIFLPISAQYYMNIVQKNGGEVRYLVSNIDSIYFSGQERPSFSYEYVDLGLSVKWATCNVGATKPEEYGDYFAWGETEPYYKGDYNPENIITNWIDGKTGYNWESYKWCTGSSNSLTKYNNDSQYGIVDNKTTLDAEDDVACVKWGGNWRLPTIAELEELQSNCNWLWTSLNGINGFWISSRKEGYTDRSIFLPVAGFISEESPNRVGAEGYYLSSQIYAYSNTPYYACFLNFYNGYRGIAGSDRYYGRSVRPVCP